MLRKSIFIILAVALFLTIVGLSITQASQEQGIPQIIEELKGNISSLSQKVESYYQELKSLISGSSEEIADLKETVETLKAKVVELERKVGEASPYRFIGKWSIGFGP